MTTRTALAKWQGGFRSGGGSITVQNSALCDVQFSYKIRFEGDLVVSPESLFAAAHAASFAMSFAKHLDAIGMSAERVDTVATVRVEILDGLEAITQVELELTAHTGSLDHARFREAALQAKNDCSVSRLVNAKITLNTKIEGAIHTSAA